MTAKTKVVNYTPEMTATILSDYAAGIPVAEIAAKVGKGLRSVVAKLVREGVYKKAEYKTKAGEKPVQKETYADQIAMLCGLTESEADSLTKANKAALAKILRVVKDTMLDANDVS